MKLKPLTASFLLGCLMSTAPFSLPAAVEQVQPHGRGASLRLTEGRLQVDFVADRIARVRATKNADWSKTPSLMRVEVAEVPGRIQVKESSATIELRSTKLVVRIDRASYQQNLRILIPSLTPDQATGLEPATTTTKLRCNGRAGSLHL